MKEYSRWSNQEVKNLFSTIEKYKEKNASLLSAFSEYAKTSGRKRNSVRNYYYQELAELQKNNKRAEQLEIDISKHTITNSILFSQEETKDIISKILSLSSQGFSIRKACLTLAKNDINKMVRYQNKYRSVLKNNPELINSIKKELKLSENQVKQQSQNINNVIYLKKQEERKISESDINSLFLGLIKMVKRSAADSVEKKIISDLEYSNSTLRKTLIKLSKAEQDLRDLSKKLEIQSAEFEKLKLENIYLKTELANFLNTKKSEPRKTLSDFISEIKHKNINVN